MDPTLLLFKIVRLEQRLNEVEAENRSLRTIQVLYESLKIEHAQLKKENEDLKEVLKQYAESKSSKKPKSSLNYSSERNEPKDPSRRKKKDKPPRRSPGRKPKDQKSEQAHCVIPLYPEGVCQKNFFHSFSVTFSKK